MFHICIWLPTHMKDVLLYIFRNYFCHPERADHVDLTGWSVRNGKQQWLVIEANSSKTRIILRRLPCIAFVFAHIFIEIAMVLQRINFGGFKFSRHVFQLFCVYCTELFNTSVVWEVATVFRSVSSIFKFSSSSTTSHVPLHYTWVWGGGDSRSYVILRLLGCVDTLSSDNVQNYPLRHTIILSTSKRVHIKQKATYHDSRFDVSLRYCAERIREVSLQNLCMYFHIAAELNYQCISPRNERLLRVNDKHGHISWWKHVERTCMVRNWDSKPEQLDDGGSFARRILSKYFTKFSFLCYDVCRLSWPRFCCTGSSWRHLRFRRFWRKIALHRWHHLTLDFTLVCVCHHSLLLALRGNYQIAARWRCGWARNLVFVSHIPPVSYAPPPTQKKRDYYANGQRGGCIFRRSKKKVFVWQAQKKITRGMMVSPKSAHTAANCVVFKGCA